MQQFTFARRTNNLPDGIDSKRTFKARSRVGALNQASKYWFGGAKVTDTLIDENGVITLLSSSRIGNVIGTLMER